MNYLFHLYLSDDDAYCRLGNLMGDFVKGPLCRHPYPPGILRGLRQHRAVDTLSNNHDAVRRSKKQLDDRFGHLKGILIDIFYDHLLSQNWCDWASGQLEDFADTANTLLTYYHDLLPHTFRPVARRMVRHNWLLAYREPESIKLVLARMSTRLSRPNILAQGYEELLRCAEALTVDCHDFLCDVRQMIKKNRI